MKISTILTALLFQTTAYATEQNDKPNLRRATEAVEESRKPPRRDEQSNPVTYFTMGGQNSTDNPRSHEPQSRSPRAPRDPRGKKQSKLVKYFTMGGKNNADDDDDDYDGDKEARIVGGSQSSPGEFPYFVDLENCGGSLIAPNVVLTAAHCGSFQGKNIYVGAYRAGSTQNNAVRVRVNGEARHPNYNENTYSNDFRLLRLAEDVTIGGSNVVLSINNQFSSPQTGEALTVMGLGLTSANGWNSPNKLRDVEINAIATNTCNQPQAYGGDVEGDKMFCAGVSGGGKDSCQGDSGGPLVKRVGNTHIQVGVVSWGDGCAEPNKPGVYARVSSAYNWIQQVACNQWNSNADFCGGSAPAPAPTSPGPAPTSPGPAPTSSGGGGVGGNGNDCPSGQIYFDFRIRTDLYGEETTWEAVSSSGNTVASGSGLDSDKNYRTRTCIPDDCYTLKIYDSYGDGLSGGGRNPLYVLRVDGEVIEKEKASNFGYERSIEFGSCNGGSSSGGGGSGGGSGNGACLPVTLNLRTDNYGDETALFLLSSNAENLIWNANGFASNKNYQFTTCLDQNECATLDIFDAWGDGILSPGYIKLTVDGKVEFNDGNIGGGVVFRIGHGC